MKILIIHQYYLEKDGAGISRFNQFAKYWTREGAHSERGLWHGALSDRHEAAKYRRKAIAVEKIMMSN